MKISRVKIKEIENDIDLHIEEMVHHASFFKCRGYEWNQIIDHLRLEMSKLDIKLTELEEYVDSTEEIL